MNVFVMQFCMYSITNNEWDTVKSKLEELLTKHYDKGK